MRALLTALCLVLLAAPVRAQTPVPLATANGWQAFQVAPHPNGSGLCGMGTSANNQGRFIWIKIERLNGQLHGFVQVGERGWNVPAATRGRLHIVIDGRIAEMHFTGTRQGNMVEASYQGAFNNFINFVETFAAGLRMDVRFPDDAMDTWAADLRGTREVTNAFIACARRI